MASVLCLPQVGGLLGPACSETERVEVRSLETKTAPHGVQRNRVPRLVAVAPFVPDCARRRYRQGRGKEKEDAGCHTSEGVPNFAHLLISLGFHGNCTHNEHQHQQQQQQRPPPPPSLCYQFGILPVPA
ncbi:hypothetical protein BDW02DRAFT_566731 [Decorospora gaudefroyi]|uniref:Uncharacterized protein n=1 Tax=Decorospora gaudefroyi TaxID=184978 RepID=A0A6A5KQY3_9PLEO|nr:hypothetical protein BDW02DRAFT_566731 [Decorospora gaudefroyi]